MNRLNKEVRGWDTENGIASLHEQYDRLDADTLEEVATVDTLVAQGKLLWVPDSRFASVLNEAGEVQIKDQIYIF